MGLLVPPEYLEDDRTFISISVHPLAFCVPPQQRVDFGPVSSVHAFPFPASLPHPGSGLLRVLPSPLGLRGPERSLSLRCEVRLPEGHWTTFLCLFL